MHRKTVVIAVYLLQICLSDWSCNEVPCRDQMDCIVPRLLSIATIVLVHLHIHCSISTRNPGLLGSSCHSFIASHGLFPPGPPEGLILICNTPLFPLFISIAICHLASTRLFDFCSITGSLPSLHGPFLHGPPSGLPIPIPILPPFFTSIAILTHNLSPF